MSHSVQRLLDIMVRLRDPVHGCPWDREQSFASIAPYTVEEAYEVADAIEKQNLSALRDELGDLLFQVVFHSQLAAEQGAFGFDEVVEAICDKMERRHPHVFGSAQVASAAEQTVAWEELKRRERAARTEAAGVLADVPTQLPAMTRAVKLGRRASQAGFDWPDVAGVLAKIDEELAEVRVEVEAQAPPARISEEIGDLLFSVANLCRHADIDPEAALRHTNAKFERRFRHIETSLAASGRQVADAGFEELDDLWNQAKQRERE